MNTKRSIQTMNRELKKWVTASEKFKVTETILYGKLKASLMQFQSEANSELLNRIQSQLGMKLFLIINSSFS